MRNVLEGSATKPRQPRTFRAGLYLNKTFTAAERRMTELERAQISARIKEARLTAGLTQDELADLLDVQQRSVANYESVRVPWRLIDRIAEVTGRTTEWILYGRDPGEASGEERLAHLEEMVAKMILMLEQQLEAGTPDTSGDS